MRDDAHRFEVIARAVRPPPHGVRAIVEIEHVGATVTVEIDHEDALDVDIEGQRRRAAHADRLAERSEAEVRPVGDGPTVDPHDVRRAVTGHVGEEHVRIGEVRRRTIGARGDDLRSLFPAAGRVLMREQERAPGAPHQVDDAVPVEVAEPRRGRAERHRWRPRPLHGPPESIAPAGLVARRRHVDAHRVGAAVAIEVDQPGAGGVAGELRQVRDGAGTVPGTTEIRPHARVATGSDLEHVRDAVTVPVDQFDTAASVEPGRGAARVPGRDAHQPRRGRRRVAHREWWVDSSVPSAATPVIVTVDSSEAPLGSDCA